MRDKVCPRCGDAHARKSALHTGDGLLRLAMATPYRCRACRYRYWRVSVFKPLLAVGVIALAVFVGWWIPNLDRKPTVASSEAAFSTVNQRAARGDAAAALELGTRYAEGNGVVKSDKTAARWLEKAARANVPEAQYRYGLALLDGRGVVQDYTAAFDWIRRAAHSNYPEAQMKLGELYRYGTGTPADKARAYLWFNLAAAQGLESAAKARDGVAWQLEPAQLAAMQAEARKLSQPGSLPAAATAAPQP